MKKTNLWVLFALCGLASASVGVIMNCEGVFFTPVSDALGMKRGTLAFCATIIAIVPGFCSIVSSKFFNQKNYKKALIVSTIVCCVGLILEAFAKSITAFYLLSVVVSIGMSTFNMALISILINNNIFENVGTYTGIIFSTCGVMGALFSPILTKIIEATSYKFAYLFEAILVFLCCLPSFFVDLKYENKKQVIKNHPIELKKVVLVSIIAYLVCSACAFPQHFIGMATSKGISATDSALLLSGSMVGNIVFKLIFGKVSDMIGSVKSIIIALICSIVGNVMVLSFDSLGILVVGAFVYGAIYSISSVLNAELTRKIFKEDFAKVYPIVQFVGNVGQGLALSLIGYVYDFTNSYQLAGLILIGFSILGIYISKVVEKE